MNNRVEKFLRQAEKQPGFEGALITDGKNRFYLFGMRSSAGTAVIFKDAAYFIIDFRYIELAQKTVKNAMYMLLCEVYWEL